MAKPTNRGLGSLSGKRILVDKANSTIVIASAVTAAIVVFALFASFELVGNISYQNQVIGYREEARDQLKENEGNVDTLKNSYIAWDDEPESIIGTADKNSKIILDSLPSKYDFPAYMSSIEFIITGSGLTVESIEGTDQEATADESLIIPKVVPMAFSLTAKGSYESIKKLIVDMQRSIRPFKVSSIEIEAEDNSNDLTVIVTGESYYQPTKQVGITNQVVKKDKKFKLNTESSASTNADGSTKQ